MIGATVKFETNAGIAEGVVLGEYVGPVPASGGYITGTIYYVKVDENTIAHVRAGFIRDITPFSMEDFADMEQIKIKIRELLEAYFAENLKRVVSGNEGYLAFELPPVKMHEVQGYIADISHEIADILEENL